MSSRQNCFIKTSKCKYHIPVNKFFLVIKMNFLWYVVIMQLYVRNRKNLMINRHCKSTCHDYISFPCNHDK